MLQKKLEGAIQVGTKGLKILTLKKREIEEVSTLTYKDFYQGTLANMQINLSKMKIVKSLKRKKIALALPLSEFSQFILEVSSKIEKNDEDFDIEIDKRNKTNTLEYKKSDYIIEKILLKKDYDSTNLTYSYRVLVIQIPEVLVNSYISSLKYFEIDVVRVVPEFVGLLELMEKLEKLNVTKDTVKEKKSFFKKSKQKIIGGAITLEGLEVEEAEYDMLIDFSSIQTKMILRKNGKLLDMEVTETGGFALTERMMEEYMVDYEEAENIKFRYMNFNYGEEGAESNFVKTFDIKARVRDHNSRIKAVAERYEEKYNMKVKRIMFFGGITILQNFAKAVTKELGIKSGTIDGSRYEKYYTSKRADISPLLGLISDSIN